MDNICCKSCSSKIASASADKIMISDLKTISAVEVSEIGLEIKCRTCSNWNTFTPEGQTINYKRKGQEALHNSLKK